MADVYIDVIGNSESETHTQQEIYGLDGNDEYIGTSAVFSRMYGGDGNDDLTYSGSAAASLYGGEGNDIGQGNNGNDNISGDDGNDIASGLGGDDFLYGGAGNDILAGGPGRDSLYGGPGQDFFFGPLEPLVKGMAADLFLDFDPVDDTIDLENQFMPEVGAEGPMAGAKFFKGNHAKTDSDVIGYNPKSGALIFDPNGNDKGGAVIFAFLDPHLKITKGDFLIV